MSVHSIRDNVPPCCCKNKDNMQFICVSLWLSLNFQEKLSKSRKTWQRQQLHLNYLCQTQGPQAKYNSCYGMRLVPNIICLQRDVGICISGKRTKGARLSAALLSLQKEGRNVWKCTINPLSQRWGTNISFTNRLSIKCIKSCCCCFTFRILNPYEHRTSKQMVLHSQRLTNRT